MGKIGKTLAFFITFIVIMSSLSLLAVKPTCGQTTPALSIPQFTVSFVNRSYTTPITTTQTTDPFTGQQVTHTSGGQYVDNETIDIRIKNPPYSQATLSNGTVGQLFYSVRTKGHFADWTPVADNGYSFSQVFASNSDYTVVTLITGSGSFVDEDILMGTANVYIPTGGQEDFQVEANIGYQYTIYRGLVSLGETFASYADSGWSNTQTITTPTNSVSTNPSPTVPESSPTLTSTPTVPEFPALTIPFLTIMMATAGLLVYSKKHKH